MNAFDQQTSAFFDELTKIVSHQMRARDANFNPDTNRPFSSMLTQDEEPVQEMNPLQATTPEPEVYTRSM